MRPGDRGVFGRVTHTNPVVMQRQPLRGMRTRATESSCCGPSGGNGSKAGTVGIWGRGGGNQDIFIYLRYL